MTLKTVQSLRGCFRSKLFLQLFRRQAVGNVHDRAAIGVRMAAVKVCRIDRIVDKLRFLLVLALHSGQPTLFLEPFADETDYVNTPRVWCVVKGFVLHM